MKRINAYVDMFGPAYERTPKAVFAAIALSLAAQLEPGELDSRAVNRVWREWAILYTNDIVGQKPAGSMQRGD